jgi:4-amino-4-deoxy-L-arabinose transferase-like glycosyltransferase
VPAGLAYVRGGLPTPADWPATNPEHPLVAKYIIGFFALYLHASNLASLSFGLFSAVILFLLVRKFIGDEVCASIAVFLLAFDEINITLSIDPMLDIFMLFFGLLGLYLVLSAKRKWMFALAGTAFGLAVASKWLAVVFIVPSIIWLVHDRKVADSSLLFASAMLVYVVSYMPLILIRGFSSFLSLQLWMLHYWMNREGGTAGILVVINRLVGPFFYVSKFNPLYSLASFGFSGNYYVSLNQGANPFISFLPFPMIYLQIRTYLAGDKNRARCLLFWTLTLFLLVHVVSSDPFESWLFEPIIALSVVFAADLLRRLATKSLRAGSSSILYLTLCAAWTLLMIAVSSAFIG